MITETDTWYIAATVEGQTRAMNEYGVCVRLDYRRMRTIFREAAARYYYGADMNRILNFVLDWHEPFNDGAERHGYKSACGIEFNRRKLTGIRFQDDLDRERPFTPTGVLEQEM